MKHKNYQRCIWKNRASKTIILTLTLLTIGSSAIYRDMLYAAPTKSTNDISNLETAQAVIDINTEFPSAEVRLLGFTDQDNVIFVVQKRNKKNEGEIVCWDISTSKVASRLSLSSWISGFNLRLSTDGKFLATTNVPSAKEFKDVKVYRVSVLTSSDLKVIAVRNLSEKEDCSGVLFVPEENDTVVLKMRSLIPYENTYTYGNNRLENFSITKAKSIRSLSYFPGFEADKILSVPESKKWIILYYSSPFNNFGDNWLNDEQEKEGTIDIIDPLSGKIEWHISPTLKQPVGDPLFFISATRFISSDTVFDIKTKTAHTWSSVNVSRRFVAEVPGHPAYALFLTPSGTELRNWQTNRVVKRWTTLKEQGRISFSPDLKIMAYKREQTVQFWKFDPAWLK